MMADVQPPYDENNHPERRSYDTRVGRLEILSETLASNLTQLTNDVHELSRVMREGNKTNWSVLGTWAGILLALVIAIGNGFVVQPLNRLQTDYKEHTEYQTTQNDLDTIWRRDFLADYSQMRAMHEGDIKRLKEDAEHNKAHAHEIEKALSGYTVTIGELDQRMRGIERLVFPNAKYRAGQID